VRQLNAVYEDRRRTWAEQPPLVNRFGLLVRGHPMLRTAPRIAARVRPPRRPSALAIHVGTSGMQIGAVLLVPIAVAVLLRPDTFVEFLVSLAAAIALGAVSQPLYERGRAVLTRRNVVWEQEMRAWRALRYCSRCDQVFTDRL
jgi:hypothetical protein